jgi:large subunit ribosomal protein L43
LNFVTVNGDRKWMTVHNKTSEEISKWLNLMTLQAGDTEELRYRKHWHTDMPSIQGPWTPFTHKLPELNLAEFPDEKLGEMLNKPQTATEKLIELAKEQGCLAPEVEKWSNSKK